METAAAAAPTPLEARPDHPERATSGRARAGRPLPLRPRGGFGGYLHNLRVERGCTIRQLAAAAGVHHTYVSKLERGDRHAPDEAIVETLAAALGATPSQLDQLRWRAGLPPSPAAPAGPAAAAAGDTSHAAEASPGAGPHTDPTLTLVAEALASAGLPPETRDRLRRAIAQAVQGTAAPPPPAPAYPQTGAAAYPQPGVVPPAALPGWSAPAAFAAPPPPAPQLPPAAVPDPRASLLAGLLSGWQTLDEAAAELRVTAAYLWELVQAGYLRAWALPGAVPGSAGDPRAGVAAGVRVRREDVLALLQPVALAVPVVPAAPAAPNGALGVQVR